MSKRTMEEYLRPSLKSNKPICFCDMDGCVADYDKRVQENRVAGIKEHELTRAKNAYKDLELIPGAYDAVQWLSEHFDFYLASTSPWSCPDAWMQKRIWAEEYLGKVVKKRLILTHNKGLLKGDLLIDDRIANGVADFEGTFIHFGSLQFPDWDTTIEWLKNGDGQKIFERFEVRQRILKSKCYR